MNRSERRKLKGKFKGQNVLMNPGGDDMDRSGNTYCWMHKLNLDDIDHPTDRDKKLIEQVTFVPYKITDKNGVIIRGKQCPRCHHTIQFKDTNEGATIPGFTTK